MFNPRHWNTQVLAVAAGIAVPALVLGKAAMGISISFALLAILVSPNPARLWAGAGSFFKSLQGLLLLITLATWLPNIFQSLAPDRSLITVVRSFGLLLVGYTVWLGLRESIALRRRSWRYLLAGFLIALVFALFSKLIHPGAYWVLHLKPWQSTPMMTELKPLAALAPLAFPLLFWLAVIETRPWRYAAWATMVLFLAVTFIAVSRAPVAGLLGCALFASAAVVYRNRNRNAWWAVGLTVLGILGAMIWLKATRHIPELSSQWPFPIWLVDFERQAIWQFALDQIQRAPWFGHGVNTINLLPGADVVIAQTNDTHIMPSHPHNWVIEVLAETGIIGLVSFTTLIGTTLWHLATSYRRSADPALLSVIAISGGYLVSGLFNFSFWAAWWQLAFLMLSAIQLAGANLQQPTPNSAGEG